MQSRFIALPVGQGDGFFYQDDSVSVLVDGGRSIDGIATQFQNATSLSDLDVLICTHNDDDHANGVLGILESGIPCREVWLPARWAERLETLLVDTREFFAELVSDWDEYKSEFGNARSLDELGDKFSIEAQKDERHTDTRDNESYGRILDALESASEAIGPTTLDWYKYKYAPIPFSTLYRLRWEAGEELLVDAVAAASRIRAITLAAFHAGATLRWFEFGTSVPSIHSGITPLNCQENCHGDGKLGVFRYVALSKANRESLVFGIEPKNELPGVVFSADSNFDFPCNLSTGDYLVTAPHHGSECNKNAYTQLEPFLECAKVVRSDGRFRKRPGDSFLSLPRKRRYCTLCRGYKLPKQTLEFRGTSSGWVPSKNVRACQCQLST